MVKNIFDEVLLKHFPEMEPELSRVREEYIALEGKTVDGDIEYEVIVPFNEVFNWGILSPQFKQAGCPDLGVLRKCGNFIEDLLALEDDTLVTLIVDFTSSYYLDNWEVATPFLGARGAVLMRELRDANYY